MSRARTYFKPIAAALTIVAAYLVANSFWPERNGLHLNLDSSAQARGVQEVEEYDLTRLQVLNRAILEVKDHYVEPERVVPKQMLLAGLNAIQRTIAPVLVNYDEGTAKVTLQVHDKTASFRVDDLAAPWDLGPRFREAFAFLKENLRDEDVDLRDIEYAAVNGLLHTLDPHSILLTPEVYEDMRTSTRGEFGGLGIMIGIREGQLTVLRPMPNTPASRAGLAKGDQIVKINEESTLNMPLTEAVDRLRGAPRSEVTVWVVRPGANGFAKPKQFDLVRAVIHIESGSFRGRGAA